MNFILDVIIQGLLYSVLAMGVALTFKVLKSADLTVEGSFPLGAVVGAMTLTLNLPIAISLVLAFIGGWLAGSVTTLLQRSLKIPSLLSGILTMSGLYTINLFIAQNNSNIPLFQITTLFTRPSWVSVAQTRFFHLGLLLGIVLIIKLFLDWFLTTKKGMMLSVAGDNPLLVTSLGENLDAYHTLGYSLSNALIALGGALVVMMTRFYDLTMGFGMLVVALASVVMGDALLKSTNAKITTMAIFGSILYRFSVATALAFRLHPSGLRLMTVIIFIVALLFQPKQMQSIINSLKGGLGLVDTTKHSKIISLKHKS
jgi:putative tryptophan/tyrosine transport system permease protein